MLVISDGENRVLFHEPQPYPGGYGYHHLVELVAGPFCGTIDAESFATVRSLQSFRDQVSALYQNQIGEARLPFEYSNINLTMSASSSGQFSVEVQAIGGAFKKAVLDFSFLIDQTHLPVIMEAIDKFLLLDHREVDER